jgi:hypothetical protein
MRIIIYGKQRNICRAVDSSRKIKFIITHPSPIESFFGHYLVCMLWLWVVGFALAEYHIYTKFFKYKLWVIADYGFESRD